MASPELVTEEDCKQVLEKLLNSKEFEIISFKVLDFHNPLQGLVGEHFTLQLKYKYEEEEVRDFFVKSLSSNPLMHEFSKTLQVYEKEAFFFGLLDEYEKYGIDISFAPRGYWFRPSITVLEDLSKDHKGTPKCTLLDLEHSRKCLEAVAKFHASSIIYEKKKENELKRKFSLKDENSKILEDKFSCKEDNVATKWMMNSIQGLFELIDVIPENNVSSEKFKEKLLEIISSDDSDVGLISGVLHADLWSSNFLHKYESGKVAESKVLDFQTIKYGFLEQDVAEFLMTNLSVSLIDEQFDNLVEHYFDFLKDAISSADLDSEEILPSSEDFVSSCKNFQIAGKIHAVVDHSYTFLADEIFKEALETEASWKKFLFEDRARYCVESFNKSRRFREMISEDLIKLRDLIFS